MGSAQETLSFMEVVSMKIYVKNSTQSVMTFATSLVAAIGSAAGATMWQTLGKPKVEELAEKQQKPKLKIGFAVED